MAARKRIATVAPWIGAYLLLIAAPLGAILVAPPTPPPAGFWWDLAMALGYAAIAMLGVQFALTARFKRATAPFGIDAIYYFHRYVGVVAFALMAAHVIIVVVRDARGTGLLDARRLDAGLLAGLLAALAIAAVIVTSLGRKQLRIEYDAWRVAHVILAVIALLGAWAHAAASARYLPSPTKQVLWGALALGWLALLVHVRAWRPWQVRRRPWRVAALRREHGRAWTLSVEPVGHGGFAFQPGQFAWLTLRASPFALREHPFSIASAPRPDGRLEFTIKELGDFTRTIGAIAVGETAYVDGPYGRFSIDHHPDAGAFVFVAGGVGIAPVMSMLRTLAARGERRPLLLIYANRLWDHVAHREELESLAESLPLRIVHVLGEPPPGWRGERGYVSREILQRHWPSAGEVPEVFVCGPTPMIVRVEHALRELGVALARTHSEIFDLA